MPSILPYLTPDRTLPGDAAQAVLVGRLWLPSLEGPCIVKLDGHDLVDITQVFPTMRDLCEVSSAADVRSLKAPPIWANWTWGSGRPSTFAPGSSSWNGATGTATITLRENPAVEAAETRLYPPPPAPVGDRDVDARRRGRPSRRRR